MGFFDYMLETGNINLNVDASDWIDAIRKGGQLLIDAGSCTEKYIDAMISGCVRNGPYFLIAPGLAMPHARPELGVIETGYAIVTLKKGVEFGDKDNDPVDILIFMAAKDQATHTEEAMSQIAELCDNEEWLMELRVAKTKEDVYATLRYAQSSCS